MICYRIEFEEEVEEGECRLPFAVEALVGSIRPGETITLWRSEDPKGYQFKVERDK